MEITQFTYFQQVGSLDCNPITGEITYGLERMSMVLQNVESVFDLAYTDTMRYRDVFFQNEVEQSRYALDESDATMRTPLSRARPRHCSSWVRKVLA